MTGRFPPAAERALVVVAEIGVNHEGSVCRLARLIDKALSCDIDAIKLQTYSAEGFVSSQAGNRRERAARFAVDDYAVAEAALRVRAAGKVLFSSLLSEDKTAFVGSLAPIIKVASGDITAKPIVKRAAAAARVIVSTGGATMDEVRRAVEWVADACTPVDVADRLTLMHCVSAYPTPIEQANLAAISTLREAFPGVTVGYSNHVADPAAVLGAVALGARVVEVHFTDQKHGRDFRDHALSFDAEDLGRHVPMWRTMAEARGDGRKIPQPCEQDGIVSMRRSVMAKTVIKAQTPMTPEQLTVGRPGSGIACENRERLRGRCLRKDVDPGELIDESMLVPLDESPPQPEKTARLNPARGRV